VANVSAAAGTVDLGSAGALSQTPAGDHHRGDGTGSSAAGRTLSGQLFNTLGAFAKRDRERIDHRRPGDRLTVNAVDAERATA